VTLVNFVTALDGRTGGGGGAGNGLTGVWPTKWQSVQFCCTSFTLCELLG
jgi:hypothetical protein